MLRRKVEREGENRGENKRDEEMKKEGIREEGRTRRRRKKLKRNPKRKVVINQKKKCSVSETDKKRTDNVNTAPVKGAPCVGELAGSDTRAHSPCRPSL